MRARVCVLLTSHRAAGLPVFARRDLKSGAQMLDRRLRSEQDAEYRRALAADQERDRRQQEAAQAKAAEQQAAQAAEEKAR